MGFKICIVIILGCFSCKQEQSHFELVAELEKEHILKEAEKYFNAKPITVTAETSERSAGGQHDFYSEGDYWWPNPKQPDSAYMRKDGLTNPDNFVAHRLAMTRFSQLSGALASAYLITEDNKYINDLIPHLKAWFVNKDTKMNPNLLYAQAIKGKVTGRGIGIIDTVHLVEVAKAIQVVEKSKLIEAEDLKAIKSWFSEYLTWLTTHKFGQKEKYNGNNHSMCWAMQVAAFAELTSNRTDLDEMRDFYKEVLLPEQLASDGSFPKETARTKPYGYSLFNLDAAFGLVQILHTEEKPLFDYKTDDGRDLQLAVSFIEPYINDRSKWPFQQDVLYWEDWPSKHSSFLFAGLAYDEKELVDIWKSLPELLKKQEIIRNMPIRYPILWVSH
ncbi:alginate lyase family protein [Winogradskyella sp.]|nr:alginate lyase family protein [Winogradskyella sp.]